MLTVSVGQADALKLKGMVRARAEPVGVFAPGFFSPAHCVVQHYVKDSEGKLNPGRSVPGPPLVYKPSSAGNENWINDVDARRLEKEEREEKRRQREAEKAASYARARELADAVKAEQEERQRSEQMRTQRRLAAQASSDAASVSSGSTTSTTAPEQGAQWIQTIGELSTRVKEKDQWLVQYGDNRAMQGRATPAEKRLTLQQIESVASSLTGQQLADAVGMIKFKNKALPQTIIKILQTKYDANYIPARCLKRLQRNFGSILIKTA